MGKILVAKPLRPFNFEPVQARFEGLLFNIDRHLQRLTRQSRNIPTAARCLSLLNVLLRFSRNSYNAVLYLTAKTPEDPKRKPTYALVLPTINRQLLDLLFSLVYMLDDFEIRSLQYQQAGWREASEEYYKFKTHFSADSEWSQHLNNLKSNLDMMISEFGITREQQNNPELIPYWKHPGELKDKKTASKAFLRYLDKWLYGDTSAQAHLSFGGLVPIGAVLIADIIGGEAEKFVSDRILPQFHFLHFSRTAFVTLAIATEIDVHYKLGYKDDALYLWGAFSENVPEAKDMFQQRYEKLFGSYG
jgi:hypothetical protein